MSVCRAFQIAVLRSGFLGYDAFSDCETCCVCCGSTRPRIRISGVVWKSAAVFQSSLAKASATSSYVLHVPASFAPTVLL